LLTLEELAAKHGTRLAEDPQKSLGLTTAQAAERLALFGPNVLTPPKQTPAIVQFLRKARRQSCLHPKWRFLRSEQRAAPAARCSRRAPHLCAAALNELLARGWWRASRAPAPVGRQREHRLPLF
jgi:hypothetical protein